MNGTPWQGADEKAFITIGEKRYLRGCGLAIVALTSIGEKGAADLFELGVFAGDDPVSGVLFPFIFPRRAVPQLIEQLEALRWTDIEPDEEVEDE